MSEDNAPITVTLKAGTGFDSPWLVIRGTDPVDVVNKLSSLDGVIEATLEAAGLFVAGRAFTPPPAAPAVQQAVAPPAAPPAWGQTPAAAQQGAAPAQNTPPQRSQFAGQPHPEGKTCGICPNVLEKKKSSGGKEKWQCPEWRWNNGTPNGHGMEWIG